MLLAGLLAPLLSAPVAHGGCKITVEFAYLTPVNNGTFDIPEMHINTKESDVRNRRGTWKKLNRDCGPDPHVMLGQRKSFTCQLDFDCTTDRRYRFQLEAKSGNQVYLSKMKYFPSTDDFTERVVIDLGDAGKLFE